MKKKWQQKNPKQKQKNNRKKSNNTFKPFISYFLTNYFCNIYDLKYATSLVKTIIISKIKKNHKDQKDYVDYKHTDLEESDFETFKGNLMSACYKIHEKQIEGL